MSVLRRHQPKDRRFFKSLGHPGELVTFGRIYSTQEAVWICSIDFIAREAEVALNLGAYQDWIFYGSRLPLTKVSLDDLMVLGEEFVR